MWMIFGLMHEFIKLPINVCMGMLEKDQAHTFSRLSSRHIGWDFAPKFMQEASDLFFFFFNSAYLTFLRAKVFFSDMGDAAYRDVSQSSCSLVKQEQG